MKKQKIIPHEISGVFVFLLLGVFAVFATVTVLLGAGAYKRISERSGADSNGRLATAYLRSMLRAKDEEGALRIEEIGGVETLALRSLYDGEEFWTHIYVHDGMLRELFAGEETDFEPGRGETVCAAEDMTASLEDGLLTVRVETDGVWHEVSCALHRTAEEGAA